MSSPKLQIIHGQSYATSLEIAKRFSKSHDRVLKDIRNTAQTCSKTFSLVNFDESTYQNSRGKEYPMFNLTRDGFAMVAMSFTGPEAVRWKEAFLLAFNTMEAEIQRRNLRDGRFEQMNLFPDLMDTIGDARKTLTVTGALTILGYEGLMIPLVTRDQLVRMLKRGQLDGFNDGRNWQIFQDSFDAFLRRRRTSVNKAA